METLSLGPQPIFPAPVKPVAAPTFGEESEIAMRRNNERLRVGVSMATATSFLPKPKKAYDFKDKPAGFGPEFRSTGWEANDQAFGVLAYEDRTCLAMHEMFKVTDEEVQTLVQDYQYALRDSEWSTISGEYSRYWFYESGRDRIMICAVKVADNSFHVTIAVGETSVMDTLRMNTRFAIEDKNRSDALAKDKKS